MPRIARASSRLIAWGAFLGILVLPAFARTAEKQASQSMVSSLFQTPTWQAEPVANLLMRGGSADTLLLTVQSWEEVYAKKGGHGTVYQYNSGAKEFRVVQGVMWDQSSGVIADCSQQQPLLKFAATWRLDPQSGSLLYEGRLVGTTGPVVVDFRFSPSQQAVAVLSARGRKKSSLLPFLGGGSNVQGRHYHQVFSLPDLSALDGSTIEVPFTTEQVAFSGCWSADERFVVYTSALYQELCVVEIRH